MGKKIQITIAICAAALVTAAAPIAYTAAADTPASVEASGVPGGGGHGP